MTDDMAPDVGDGIEVARLTIIKTFDDHADGGAAIRASWSDGLALADALGMLAFAEHTIVRAVLDGDET